jgi:hypothetical protein
MHEPDATIGLTEVADLLAAHGELRCAALAETGAAHVELTIYIPHSGAGLDTTELFHELRYLADVGAMRAFAMRYGIPAERLENLLAQRRED